MCTLLTPVVEAAAAIREARDFDVADIESVEVIGNSRLADHCNYPSPTNATEAAFSATHVAAQALVHGPDISLSSFEEPFVSDQKVVGLRARTRLVVRTEWPTAFFSTPLGVAVTRKSGAREERFIEGSNGMPPRYLSTSAVVRKFRAAAAGVLPEEALSRIETLVLSSKALADVGEIARLMSGGAERRQP